MLKKYLVLLLVSVLALCSLCAFPTRENKSTSPQVELMPLEPLTPLVVSEETPTKSEDSLQSLSEEEILTLIEEKVDTITEEASYLATEVDRLNSENAQLQAEKTELLVEVAKRDVMIDSYKKIKTFMRLGCETSINKSTFSYGLTGAAGLRFKSGFSFGISASYTIGNQYGLLNFSKDSIKATFFIEYEF